MTIKQQKAKLPRCETINNEYIKMESTHWYKNSGGSKRDSSEQYPTTVSNKLSEN